MLKMKEIKDWDQKLITSKVGELRTELFSFRMQKTTSGIDKPHKIKEIKKDIAKLLTALNSKGER